MNKLISFVIFSLFITISNAQSPINYWTLSGNSNANASSKLGTANAVNLRLYTNNLERLRITSTGFVGIGTTLPNAILNVNSPVGIHPFRAQINSVTKFLVHSSGGVSIGANTNPPANGLYVSGNVGIGTTTPTQKLDVAGSINIAGDLYVNNEIFLNIKGNYNTGIGKSAFYNNTTGYFNTAIGNRALYENTTGSFNLASGAQALVLNTIGSYNVALGPDVLFNNRDGNYNTASGYAALYQNYSGSKNVSSGYYSLFSNNIGEGNVAIGLSALSHNTTGSNNSAIGIVALNDNVEGSYNTGIGIYANTNQSNLTNSTAIGAYATVTADNQVRIGSNTITSIGGYVDWSNISDRRVKKNIQDNVPGLKFINKLKPVTYNLNLEAANEIIQNSKVEKKYTGKSSSNSGKLTADKIDFEYLELLPNKKELAAIKIKERVIYTGFIAQDVEKAAKEINYDFSGIDAAKNDNDLYGLRYSQFVVPLVKSVQELSIKNDEKDIEISDLQKQIADLREIVLQLKNTSSINQNFASRDLNLAKLEQNTPNPFTSSTIISYYTPPNTKKAEILVTDMKGGLLKSFKISTGQGQLTIRKGELSKGTYNYTLYENDHKINTKQMIIVN